MHGMGTALISIVTEAKTVIFRLKEYLENSRGTLESNFIYFWSQLDGLKKSKLLERNLTSDLCYINLLTVLKIYADSKMTFIADKSGRIKPIV